MLGALIGILASRSPVVTPAAYVDPYFSQVVLLLHGTGPHLSTSIVDSSLSAKICTASSTTSLRTNQSKIGGSSIGFDGTGKITIPPSTDFDLGDTYTIEFWVMPSGSITGHFGLVHRGLYATITNLWSGLAVSIRWLGTFMRFYFYAESSANEQYIDVPGCLVSSVWTHIAMVRNGATGTVFVNGIASGSVSALTIPTSSVQPLQLGAWEFNKDGNITNEYFNGYLDEVRITKGVARYQANFTPAVYAFSDEVIVTQDPYFDSVSLLLHGDGVNLSSSLVDSSKLGHTPTAQSGAYISTDQSKFGGASIYFDGTTNCTFSIPHHASLDLFDAAAWTIEGWFNIAGTDGILLDKDGRGNVSYPQWRPVITTTYIGIILGSGNGVSSLQDIGSPLLPAIDSTWFHVAITKVGSNVHMYRNGVRVHSAAITASMTSGGAALVCGNEPAQIFYSRGYLDDFRVTKGVARYVADFVPPSLPFTGVTPSYQYINDGIVDVPLQLFSTKEYTLYQDVVVDAPLQLFSTKEYTLYQDVVVDVPLQLFSTKEYTLYQDVVVDAPLQLFSTKEYTLYQDVVVDVPINLFGGA